MPDSGVMRSRFRLGFAGAIALTLAVGCGDDEGTPLEHGFVKIQLVRSENQADSPFIGTGQIFAAMEYDTCLQNFYAMNPNYQQSGADGSLVFGRIDDGGEGWQDRLCENPEARQAECEVAQIEQELDNSSQLRITYNMPSDDIGTKFLKFGPVPNPELANCEGGLQPIVRLVAPVPVRGFNAQGAEIWETSSFDNPEAVPGQGAELVVKISRNE